MKTSHAIIFRLSNKTIQVTFKDQTEIILFNDIVCYKDKNKNVRIYKIDEAFNSCNFEMNKRIKYVQNIFTKIINVNSQKNNNN
jgi:polo-like kinase 1